MTDDTIRISRSAYITGDLLEIYKEISTKTLKWGTYWKDKNDENFPVMKYILEDREGVYFDEDNTFLTHSEVKEDLYLLGNPIYIGDVIEYFNLHTKWETSKDLDFILENWHDKREPLEFLKPELSKDLIYFILNRIAAKKNLEEKAKEKFKTEEVTEIITEWTSEN